MFTHSATATASTVLGAAWGKAGTADFQPLVQRGCYCLVEATAPQSSDGRQ